MAGRSRAVRKVGAKGAETRRRLIETAAKRFFTDGISATSLDQIAADAGVTKGAIYDHFSSKSDLVFALLASHGNPLLGAVDDARPNTDQRKAIKAFLLASMPASLTYLASSFEAYHYVARHPDLGKRISEMAEDGLKRIAARIEETVDADQMGLSPLELTLAISALNTGLLFHRLIAPGLVTDDVAGRVYDRILGLELDREASANETGSRRNIRGGEPE